MSGGNSAFTGDFGLQNSEAKFPLLQRLMRGQSGVVLLQAGVGLLPLQCGQTSIHVYFSMKSRNIR